VSAECWSAAHDRNVAEVNARVLAEKRCLMHNTDVSIPARYVMLLPIGNEITLCVECCAWWRQDAAETGDPETQPIWIREIPTCAS
jgi:hypothetical protein